MMMNCVLFVMISLVAADVSCKTKCCKIENGKPQKEFEDITDILSKLTQAFMVYIGTTYMYILLNLEYNYILIIS